MHCCITPIAAAQYTSEQFQKLMSDHGVACLNASILSKGAFSVSLSGRHQNVAQANSLDLNTAHKNFWPHADHR